MKDPDSPTNQIKTQITMKSQKSSIKEKVNRYLESISWCERGSTTSGPERWFLFRRVPLAGCPPSMPLSTSLILKVFLLLAMEALLCQGYSGLTGISKVRRHVASGCHILLAERSN